MGGLCLQRCVCLFLARPEIAQELDLHTAAFPDLGGDLTRFDIPSLRSADEERIIATFRDLRNKDCAEIIEECETKFVKEIEFEHFRQRRGPPTSLRRHVELRTHDVPGHDARRACTALEISG